MRGWTACRAVPQPSRGAAPDSAPTRPRRCATWPRARRIEARIGRQRGKALHLGGDLPRYAVRTVRPGLGRLWWSQPVVPLGFRFYHPTLRGNVVFAVWLRRVVVHDAASAAPLRRRGGGRLWRVLRSRPLALRSDRPILQGPVPEPAGASAADSGNDCGWHHGHRAAEPGGRRRVPGRRIQLAVDPGGL
eukprot:scaffold63670_cov63-Phaeocystis_antarctica.AAC.2